MKFKVTGKYIKTLFPKVIRVGYCELWHLLKCQEPVCYTCGVYGWNSDIYYFNNNVALSTGYSPIGNIRPSYEVIKKYEKHAREIWEKYNMSYEEQKQAVQDLLNAFIKEVTQ